MPGPVKVLKRMVYFACLLAVAAIATLWIVEVAGLLGPERSDLMDRKMIAAIPQSAVRSGADIFSDEVAFVCNFGPYQGGAEFPGSIDLNGHPDLLAGLERADVFPVAEGVGVFIYFDANKDYLGADESFLYRGEIRWKQAQGETAHAFCAPRDAVRAVITLENSARYLSLSDRGT
ncbi:MAG: hypothetical protein WBC93_04870 [Sulfitobacter sp.]